MGWNEGREIEKENLEIDIMNYKESWNYLVYAHKKGQFKEESQIQSDWETYFAE